MDTKWTNAGKVLIEKEDIKKLGLNNVDADEPDNPEQGENWHFSTDDTVKHRAASDWLSTGLYKKLKRTTDETNGPFLNELIDSKNDITNNTATTFMNVSIPNKDCASFILIDYILNTENKIVYRTGQVRVNLSREAGTNVNYSLSESIAGVDIPSGETFFFSVDGISDKIYKHDAFSDTILSSFAAPASAPFGIAWDGVYLYTMDLTVGGGKIYQHSGFSDRIIMSFSSPSTAPRAIAYDGNNLITCDSNSSKIYQHSGISADISDSFSSPGTAPYGVSWDGTNVLSLDQTVGTGRIYKHDGFDTAITASFSSPIAANDGLDIAWDGTHLYSTNNVAALADGKIFQHSGFTDTISDSFTGPSEYPSGIVWGYAAETLTSVVFSFGALSGGVSATQTLPTRVTCNAASSGSADIRYSARILSGGYDDATSGCEVTLAAA